MRWGARSRRRAWAVASLGGLAALVLGALVPGAAPADASPRTRPRDVDPDVSPADDSSTGEFQSCSVYYGFGKSWAHVQIKVDDEIDRSLTFPDDYNLVLSGDVDPSSPGTEKCVPERLTEADWSHHFSGLVPPYAQLVPLPHGTNIVIPGPFSTTGATGSPLQLRIDGDFEDLVIETRTASVPNFHDSAAFTAAYQEYLVDQVGQSATAAFLQPCVSTPPQAQQNAAAQLFGAMDPAFQSAFVQASPPGPPFTNCALVNNFRQFHQTYWFPYAWGVENPITFELDPRADEAAAPPAATPITPAAITFTG
jgi:hypothetical protein